MQTMELEEGVRCGVGITPWFARSFVGGATQAIGVALQRPIVRDQFASCKCVAPPRRGRLLRRGLQQLGLWS